MASGPKRVVRFSPEARLDLAESYSYTAHHWGTRQADQYREMLFQAAENLAESAETAKAVKGHPELRYVFVKWTGARYGHNIIFEPDAEGIYIVRILHSSMDVSNNLR